MTEMNIDPRVSLPEEKAPDNDADRRAVLSFFDGFARGNDKAVSKMLPDTDRPQLAALVENGSWAGTTSHISKIDVQCGTSPTSDKCALAVIEVKGAGEMFQPQLWTYNTAEDHAVFDAVATPPSILDKLSGDWISRWYQILEEEVALASKADDEYTMAQRDLDTHASDSDTGGGGPGSGGPGKLRPPPAAPVDPPDIPGGGVTPGGGGRPGRP
jgi:hypothetical protein